MLLFFLQNEEQPTVDEATHDGPDIECDTKEASSQAGGFLSQEVLDPTHTREPGDDRHGRGRPVGREEYHQEAAEAQEAPETSEIRGKPGRELLLLLAHAHIRLRALQPLDVDRPTEFARAPGTRPRGLDKLRRFHRSHILPGRGGTISHGLPRAGSHGLQQQKARRSLLQVAVVLTRHTLATACGPAATELRDKSDVQVSQVLQNLPGHQVLLHRGVENGLSESLAGT